MIANKINYSLSRLKKVSIKPGLRFISNSNTLLKNSNDSNDDGSGSSPPRKDSLSKLLFELTENAKKISELPQQQKIALAEPRKVHRQKRAQEAEEKKKEEEDEEKKPLEIRLENAAKSVAQAIGGDQTKTESELLNALLSLKPDREAKPIKDVLKGMKTESARPRREKTEEPLRRSQYVRAALADAGRRPGRGIRADAGSRPARVVPSAAVPWLPEDNVYSLFGESPIGIFPADYKSTAKDDPVNIPTWRRLVNEEIKFTVTHPPKNYFEEMIQWTEQGKLWLFPIDNEQGMEEEQKVHFSEHVMLQDHFESWCPPKGPIRHFMELVSVGLSKNPYLTVQEKKDHINFYRDYFKSKNALLKETGCGEIKDIPILDSPENATEISTNS
ncbi:unnamed protein product [Bemisia tabaci]|uniref:Small ribosomal subunit protein mS31 n=1 Tax=Bemisia tabaci TaxID=7038 RepID=A0A9P0F3R4_BEMTA|nr:unnamed protein product [Bemisia tabaci]